MINYLRLVRFPNLLIIMLTQVMVRYCLILPAFKTEYFVTGIFPRYLSDLNFALLITSTIIIAAAGYIINDYFDVQIDEINKPGKNIVGKIISNKDAKSLYFILSVIGVIIGFYLGFQISKPMIGMLPLFSAISLYMYSSYYKRRLFSGNIIVAVLSALSVMLVGLYEPEFYRNFIFLIWYGMLAFLLSFIRELLKDIQDINGDELTQCKTVPIVLGIPRTKIVIVILIFLTSVYITNLLYKNFFDNGVINFWYLVSLFLIPLIALSYLVISASGKKDFYYASLFTKIIMIGGITTIFLFWKYFLS